MSELLFETDWLASRPVYYNEATGAASHRMNDVVDFAEVELDPEGLNAYLGTGYSVFERTPVRGVRSLPPSARLWRGDGGHLRVEEIHFDLEGRLGVRRSEDELIEMLRARVAAAEAADGEIVIPTSGGYDSRLLNLLITDPRRIRSFTYGPSARQWDSMEIARARALADLLGAHWEAVPLCAFHDYLDDWDAEFGAEVHAHGMYQMEFYDRVRERVARGAVVFSGLFGDLFGGAADDMLPPVADPSSVRRLILTYGQHADPAMSRLPWSGELAEQYFERHRELATSLTHRIVELGRFRLRLTHYLLRVPRLFGFRVEAPYIEPDIACGMLTLPDERRLKRRWIVDYLTRRGARLQGVRGSSEYWLYWPAMRRRPLQPLDAGLLGEIVRPEYVRWINRTVGVLGLWYEGYQRLGGRRGFRRAADLLQACCLPQRRLEAYHAYMTLRPLQRLLEKRDAARGSER
jgi:asparagine synthetase B (glutamine-hydrolysing)